MKGDVQNHQRFHGSIYHKLISLVENYLQYSSLCFCASFQHDKAVEVLLSKKAYMVKRIGQNPPPPDASFGVLWPSDLVHEWWACRCLAFGQDPSKFLGLWGVIYLWGYLHVVWLSLLPHHARHIASYQLKWRAPKNLTKFFLCLVYIQSCVKHCSSK